MYLVYLSPLHRLLRSAWVRVCVLVSNEPTLSSEATHQRGKNPLAMDVYLRICCSIACVYVKESCDPSFFSADGGVYMSRNSLSSMATGLSHKPSMRNLAH